jgi:autotransporter-associated beta strand protein
VIRQLLIRTAGLFAVVAASEVALVRPAAAVPVEVTYGNQIYTLQTTSCFAPGRLFVCVGASDFRASSWYGNSQLANDLSNATTNLLGLPNAVLGGHDGPYFVYYSGSTAQYNDTALPFYGFKWDPWLLPARAYADGGTWNTFTGRGTHDTYWLAIEAAAPRPIPTILQVNNGTSINTTASLLANTLLPQFQGGTLTVSAAGTFANNFTLDDSSTNSIDIDAAVNSATFSGVFSDQSGSQGAINFLNSTANGAILTLTGQSTYSGLTSIWDNATVAIGVANALPASTELILYGNGRFQLANHNQTIAAIGGSGRIELGSGTLTLNLNDPFTRTSSAEITGTGGLTKGGGFTQVLNGTLSYSGQTLVNGGTLVINGTSASAVLVQPNATLAGTGVINANVNNFGMVAPGQSIGTLTINGNYFQDVGATLAIEVAGSGQSDLLRITGAGRVVAIQGTLRLTSYQGAPITPGLVYTAVTVPQGTVGGAPGLQADTGGVAGTSGYRFVREIDPQFSQLANGTAVADPTKLQFGWFQLKPTVSTPTPADVISTSTLPGPTTINAVKPTGGAITQAITGSTTTLQQQCVANTGNATACQTSLSGGGSGSSSGSNGNTIAVAKGIDAGMSSVYAAVNTGITGGTPIPTATGGSSGYTSHQATAAAVTPDFVTVYGALFSLPTRAQLNQALHAISAEPYAAMQSVALEAMEQFRVNALALSKGDKAIRLLSEVKVCRLADGTLVPADSPQRPKNCKPRAVSQASRWSLLIDATNTQASLNGSNDLASLDYNIFQSNYGLQYDASKQWSLGGAFGYGQANLHNYQYANSTIKSNTFSGGVWAVYRPSEPWRISGLLGYMNLQYGSSRALNFGGLNRTAQANWVGQGLTSAIEAEYQWIFGANKADRNAVRLKPKTYFAYSLHSQGDFSELGADSLNLAMAAHRADSLIYGIGLTLEAPVQVSRATRVIPRLAVAYEYDFNGNANEEHALQSSFAQVPALGSFEVLGQNRGSNDLNVALSVEVETSDQLSVYAGVAGSFLSQGNELSYGGGLRWRFGGSR